MYTILICATYVQVLFCSTENGRSSFVRQLEPDWHIDSNPEIVTQLAVCSIYFSFIHQIKFMFWYNSYIVKAIRSPSFILSSNDLTTNHIAEVYQVSTSCISLQNWKNCCKCVQCSISGTVLWIHMKLKPLQIRCYS